jgi:hypothetical protein
MSRIIKLQIYNEALHSLDISRGFSSIILRLTYFHVETTIPEQIITGNRSWVASANKPKSPLKLRSKLCLLGLKLANTPTVIVFHFGKVQTKFLVRLISCCIRPMSRNLSFDWYKSKRLVAYRRTLSKPLKANALKTTVRTRMNAILRTLLIGLMLTVSGGVVSAGPYEDAVAAAERGDYATAVRLWRALAEQGNARAQGAIGRMYERGLGVNQDDREAVKWYAVEMVISAKQRGGWFERFHTYA